MGLAVEKSQNGITQITALGCKSVGFRGFFFFFFYDAEIFLYIVLFVFADGAHSQSEGGGPFHNI